MRCTGVRPGTIDDLMHPRRIKTDQPKVVFDTRIRPVRRD